MREWGKEEPKKETAEEVKKPDELFTSPKPKKTYTPKIETYGTRIKINYLLIWVTLLIWYLVFSYWANNPGFIGPNIQTVFVGVVGIITFKNLVNGKFVSCR